MGQAPATALCQCGGMGLRVWLEAPQIAVEGGTRANHRLAQKMKEVPMDEPMYNAALGKVCTGREAEKEARERGWTSVGNEEPARLEGPRPVPDSTEIPVSDDGCKVERRADG